MNEQRSSNKEVLYCHIFHFRIQHIQKSASRKHLEIVLKKSVAPCTVEHFMGVCLVESPGADPHPIEADNFRKFAKKVFVTLQQMYYFITFFKIL